MHFQAQWIHVLWSPWIHGLDGLEGLNWTDPTTNQPECSHLICYSALHRFACLHSLGNGINSYFFGEGPIIWDLLTHVPVLSQHYAAAYRNWIGRKKTQAFHGNREAGPSNKSNRERYNWNPVWISTTENGWKYYRMKPNPMLQCTVKGCTQGGWILFWWAELFARVCFIYFHINTGMSQILNTAV